MTRNLSLNPHHGRDYGYVVYFRRAIRGHGTRSEEAHFGSGASELALEYARMHSAHGFTWWLF